MKKLSINDVFDNSELVFWSFRYFLGRMTASTCDFATKLAVVYPHLPSQIRNLIKKELESAFEKDDKQRAEGRNHYMELGHDCDRRAWELVRKVYNSK